MFVRGFKWALVSQRRHIGEVRHSIRNGSFTANMPSLSWTEKTKGIKSENFVVASVWLGLPVWLLCGAQQHVFQGLSWKRECRNSREQKTNRQFVTH